MRISIAGVSKSFGAAKVLRDINLEIPSGSFTTILGVSGCGKTTLLRILAGLEQADEGSVYFDQRCISSCSEGLNLATEKRNLGFVFQDFALWPHLNVFENVAFGLRCRGRKKGLDETVHGALAAVRLTGLEKRYPHQLSGGQQQRVSFARAIAVDPGCILFDEPLSALDAVLREELRVELREYVSSKAITAVFVTHDQTEAMSLSDMVVIMDGGRIIQSGPPEQIYTAPSTPFVGNFVGRSNWLDGSLMVRPEHVTLAPSDGARRLSVQVAGVSFLGHSYLLSIKNDAIQWSMYVDRKIDIGARLDVYVRPEHILTCPREA